MADRQPVDVLRHLQDEPIDIGEGAIVAGDLADDKGAHAAKARQIKPFGLVEHKAGDPVREAAPEIAPERVLLFVVEGVDDLVPGALRVGEKALHFLWWVLQIVIHRDDMRPARVTQSGHDGVVLAIIAREIDQRDRDAGPLDEGAANSEAVVRTGVIDQHDLVSARDLQLFECGDELADAGGAVINRDDDRQREARRGRSGGVQDTVRHQRSQLSAGLPATATSDPPNGKCQPACRKNRSSAVAARPSASIGAEYARTSLVAPRDGSILRAMTISGNSTTFQ